MVSKGFKGFFQSYCAQSVDFGQTFLFFLYIAIVCIESSSKKANPRSWTGQHRLVFIDSKLCETIGVGCRVYPRKKAIMRALQRKKSQENPVKGHSYRFLAITCPNVGHLKPNTH